MATIIIAFIALIKSLIFLISNSRLVLNVVFFLLDESLASEFDVPTFRNTLFHLYRLCAPNTYEYGTECSEMSAHKIQKTEYDSIKFLYISY
jgi:hypothetical protein